MQAVKIGRMIRWLSIWSKSSAKVLFI